MARTMGHAWFALARRAYWQTKGPSISNRCVVVDGTYSSGAGGHFGMFNGTIRDVLRLDVWSTPHRPFVTTPPPPPPSPTEADSACSEKPSTPEKRPDAGAGQTMLAEFNKLYETGDFQLAFCLGAPTTQALSARTAGRSAGVGRRRALAGSVTTATVLPVMSKNSTE
jgi:hypothetical protein